MNGRIDLTTLLFLGAAVVIFLMLRNVLGRRTGDESGRYERYKQERAAQEARIEAAAKEKVVKLPRRDRDSGPAPVTAPNDTERAQRMTRFAAGNADLAKNLIEVSSADPEFDPEGFMKGATSAYEMIVMAFAEGNKGLLDDLLSPEVFEGFVSVIDDRASRSETIEQSFVGIKAAEMLDAEMKGRWAQVTVRFVSELISATRSASGDVVAGDPKRIKEVTDVWTFARDTSTDDPNWKLIATQGAA